MTKRTYQPKKGKKEKTNGLKQRRRVRGRKLLTVVSKKWI